jgi:hypothetical protein
MRLYNYLSEEKLQPGTKVKISHGSGVMSDKTGVIVPHDSNRKYAGHYKPVDTNKEYAIKLDDGEIITMFKNRVSKV